MTTLIQDLARAKAAFQQRAIVAVLNQRPEQQQTESHPTAEALRQQWARYSTSAGPMTAAVEAAANLIDRQAETIALYQDAERQRTADLAKYLGSNLKPVKLSETTK